MFNKDAVSVEVKHIGRQTFVTFYDINGTVVGSGIAQCNVTDTFNAVTGEMIATFRAQQDFEEKEFLQTLGA